MMSTKQPLRCGLRQPQTMKACAWPWCVVLTKEPAAPGAMSRGPPTPVRRNHNFVMKPKRGAKTHSGCTMLAKTKSLVSSSATPCSCGRVHATRRRLSWVPCSSAATGGEPIAAGTHNAAVSLCHCAILTVDTFDFAIRRPATGC